jgi:hypothetical protein
MRADRLGQLGGFPAEGVYIVADMTVEKLSDETGAVPIESITLRGGVVIEVDFDATESAESDDRTDGESLASATVAPGQPVRGVLVYDAPRDESNDYYIRLTPPDKKGDDAAHIVPVGPYDELPPLG